MVTEGATSMPVEVIPEEEEQPLPPSFYEMALKDFETKKNRFLFDCSNEKIKEIAKNLTACLPDFESQIAIYLEADDPDFGIEEEYHPKNDQ
jgi:hypothetical protein